MIAVLNAIKILLTASVHISSGGKVGGCRALVAAPSLHGRDHGAFRTAYLLFS